MARTARMPGTVPLLVLVLTLFTVLGIGGSQLGSEDGKPLLPTGLRGRWGEDSIQINMWVSRGSSIIVPCHLPNLDYLLDLGFGASATDIVNVTWVKDNETLHNRRSFVTATGSLNITKLIRRRGRISPESDDGEYRCVVSVMIGVPWVVSGPPVNLHVADFGRHVSVLPANASLVAGEALRLSCQVSSEPSANYRWEKAQGDLPQDGRISQFQNDNSGVLQITNVQQSDAGSYKCFATNNLLNKTRESDAVFVAVKEDSALQSTFIPPTFLFPMNNLSLRVVEGQSTKLGCLATGLPLPTISWQRKILSNGNNARWQDVVEEEGRVSFTSSGDLHIKEVAVTDGGIYACTAKCLNPLTEKQSTVTQEIVVEISKPPVIVNSSKNVTTLIAKTVRLNCSLPEHVPFTTAPRISWYKNGYPIIPDTRIEVTEQNQLIFVNSITKDTGVYQCMALNEAGYATSWSYLLVNSSQDHPYPPQNLRYFLLSPTSVLLEWDVVETSSPIQAYSIHFTELGDKPTEFQFVSQTNSHLLKQLNPHTNYSFFVRAYSTQASDPSETVVFRTGEDVPLDVPEFHTQATSHSTILVTWSPLSPDKARGTVTGYKVQWQRRSKDYYNLNEVGSDVFQQELTGLHPGKTYKVRVLARTKAGYNEGTDWPWKLVSMPDTDDVPIGTVPLAPLVIVQLIGSSSDNTKSVNVSWERPSYDTSTLDGYTLKYKRQNSAWSEDINLPATSSSYVIQGLDSDWYKVKVRGFNNKGEGLSAIEMIHTADRSFKNRTTNSEPKMPTIEEVTVAAESQTSIKLSWKVKEGSEKVAFYTIQRRVVSGSKEQSPVFTRSTKNSISVDGLTPFSVYDFSVRAHTSDNEYGPYSPHVEASTVGNIPTAPGEIRSEPIDASTVKLSWNVIQISDGPPTKYQIIYTVNKTLSLSEWKQEEVKGDQLSSAQISGLVSNTEYWFRVRGCSETNCGAYSDPFPACIPAILPPSSQPSQLYIIIGLVGTLAVLLLFGFLAVYIIKFRNMSNSSNTLPCNGSRGGFAGNKRCENIRGQQPSGGRNGNMADINGGDGDYIPMLNRIHTDIPATTLDTKGGYPNCHVNGFTNPRCNGVIRGKELRFTANVSSGKAVETEECEHLFAPSATLAVQSLDLREQRIPSLEGRLKDSNSRLDGEIRHCPKDRVESSEAPHLPSHSNNTSDLPHTTSSSSASLRGSNPVP